MTKREKRFLKLLNNPKETSFGEIHTILNDFGYRLDRIKGSHHIYGGPKGEVKTIPIHKNKVKKQYVKDLIKLLYEKNKGQ